MNKFTLYDDSKYENHATNEIHLEGSSSEGLEEAVKQYIKDCVALKFPTSDAKLKETDIRAAFLAGAEWQKEKDVRDMLMSDCREFEKCYELGKKDMKEQMMKDAVERTVHIHEDLCPYIRRYELAFDIKTQIQDIKEGDKVKLIIIKEKYK